MFYSEFDSLLPESLRESAHPNGGLLPPHLLEEIEEMNDWVYNDINNGVYKTGFATSQEAYESNLLTLFSSLDKIEFHLASQKYPGPYLFGEYITDADIRLFPTIVRFDVGYYTLFMCNLKIIRYEYPHIQKWFEGLYFDEGERTRGAFGKSTDWESIRKGYAKATGRKIVPLGPEVLRR
jgi:putative glutathione S-transferase